MGDDCGNEIVPQYEVAGESYTLRLSAGAIAVLETMSTISTAAGVKRRAFGEIMASANTGSVVDTRNILFCALQKHHSKIKLADVEETSVSYMADESTLIRVKMVGDLLFDDPGNS